METIGNPQPDQSSARKFNWEVPIVIALLLLLSGCFCILLIGAFNLFYSIKIADNSKVSLVATNTPAPIPTPLPNPQFHPGKILYEYPFDTSENWPIYNDNNEYVKLERTVKDGKYRWSMTAKQGVFTFAEPKKHLELPDDYYQVSVDVRMIEGPQDAAYGIVFGYGDYNDHWLWEVTENGTGSLIEKRDGNWMDISAMASSLPIHRKETNTLTVKVSKKKVYYYINGWEVGVYTLPDSGFSSEFRNYNVGLSLEMRNPGDQAVVEFDNLVISKPENFE